MNVGKVAKAARLAKSRKGVRGALDKTASGGELSRLMLAMKAAGAAHDGIPSMIFDEIDTGISGIAAQRVAEKIAALANSVQIICVTHLPQIAAMGTHNFRIFKEEKSGCQVKWVMV